YAGHWLLDTFFDFRPWDYTEKPFNINGRICLEDSLRFVVLGIIELYVVLPLVEGLLGRVSRRQNLVIFSLLVAAFAFDIVYSLLVMLL
ncbi:MAG: putative ABC transporter permease, partial [Coriobacteriales bacterium]|nr:putative ABC transporter permease [Coriobacteriales bacterium]